MTRRVTKGWARKFDEPIPLPKGKPLITLRNAALHITKLPTKGAGFMGNQDRPVGPCILAALLHYGIAYRVDLCSSSQSKKDNGDSHKRTKKLTE